MLILTRRLGFSAPEHVTVHRQEVYERIRATRVTNGSLLPPGSVLRMAARR
jgi:sRNA-binding carbon storage regulator CsrA